MLATNYKWPNYIFKLLIPTDCYICTFKNKQKSKINDNYNDRYDSIQCLALVTRLYPNIASVQN